MSKSESGSSHVVVGEVTSVYGIKGWVKVRSFTQNPETIFKLGAWFLSDKARKNPRQVVVDEYRPHGKAYVVHVQDYDDRDCAIKLTNLDILVSKDALPKPGEDEIYWTDLEALSVFNLKGEKLGIIASLMETGANPVLIVKPCDDSVDKQERLIPYVLDHVVKQVNVDKGCVIVDWELDY